MANEVVTIRINVSADTREIDKVKRKLAGLSAQSAVTGGDVGDLADEVDRVGGSSRKSSRDIDAMSRSTQQFSRNSRSASNGLTGMSKVLHSFLGKLGGIGMFVMKAWVIQTALLGAGLASITAGFKIAAGAGKLFQASMAAVAAGAAAAVVAVTTAAAAYRQYIAATNAANYTAGPMGSRQNEAMGAFRAIQSDKELGSLGVTSVNAAFAGISQQTAFTGDMKESLKSLADFAIASGDVEKGMAAAGQFLGALRKEGKITDQVAALGEGLGVEFQTALQEAVKGGKISEADFLSALNAGALNQKVAGLLDGVNQTLFGQAKSFMGEAISMAGDIGQSFLPDVQVAFDKMTSILRVAFLRIGADLGGFAKGDFVNSIVSATQKISDFTVNLFEKYLPKADGMLTKLGKGWNDTKNWFRGFRNTLDELKTGGQILIDTFAPFFNEFFGGFGDGFRNFNQLIVDNKDKFLEFGDALARAWDALQGLGDSLRKAFVKSLPAITRVVNLLEKLFTILSGLTTAAASNPLTALAPLIAGFAGFGYLKSSGFRKGVNKRMGGGAGGGGFFPMMMGRAREKFGLGGATSRTAFGRFGQGLGGGDKFDWRYGMNQSLMPKQKGSFADIHRGYMGQRYPNQPGAHVPLSRQGRFGAGMAKGVAAAGRVAPYAMMMGSLFGTEEAQIPLLAGGMLASYNPTLGAGVAGVGMAATSKTRAGGGVSGALGGAALGAMLPGGPITIIAGAIVGGVAGAIMGAVNKSRELKEAAQSFAKSVSKNTRETVTKMEVSGESAKDINKFLSRQKGFAKELKTSANMLKVGNKDAQEFKNIVDWTKSAEDRGAKGLTRDFLSGKISAKEAYARATTGGTPLSDADAAAAERGRAGYKSGISMRNRALRGLKKGGAISEDEFNKMKDMLSLDKFASEAPPEISKIMEDLTREQRRFAKRVGTYEDNVGALSRASGLASEDIADMAKKAGVNLYDSGMNLADTLDEIGAALPTTVEEMNQRFRAKAIQGIEDIFGDAIAANEALKAIDQIGEEIRGTKGPIGEDQALVYMRDMFQQSIAAYPDDIAATLNMMKSFMAGGSQYAPGGALVGREKEFTTGKVGAMGQMAYAKTYGFAAEEVSGLLANAIAKQTGKNVDVNALKPQIMQLDPGQLAALSQASAKAMQPGQQTGGMTVQQSLAGLMAGAGLQNLPIQLSDATTGAALAMQSGMTTGGQQAGQAMGQSLTAIAPLAGASVAQPMLTNSTSVGQNVSNGFGFGAAGHGMTIGNAAAGPMRNAVSAAIASAPPLKVEAVPAIQVNVTTTPAPAGPGGDTTSSRLASTMARHRSMNGMLAGKRSITSSLRSSNLGSLGSDHATGNAYDLVGQNLGAYQQLVQSTGGFAEFHNGGGRHLHVVPGPGVPAGDSATPAMVSAGPAMATTSNNPVYNISVNGGNASAEAIADTVMAKIAEKERSMKERS